MFHTFGDKQNRLFYFTTRKFPNFGLFWCFTLNRVVFEFNLFIILITLKIGLFLSDFSEDSVISCIYSISKASCSSFIELTELIDLSDVILSLFNELHILNIDNQGANLDNLLYGAGVVSLVYDILSSYLNDYEECLILLLHRSVDNDALS